MFKRIHFSLSMEKFGGYLEAWRFIRKSQSVFYYIYPSLCEQDIIQAEFAKKCKNVRCISFVSNKHGSPVLSFSLPILLSMDNDELENIYQKNKRHAFQPILFSVYVSGFRKTIIFIVKKLYCKLKRLLESNHACH